MNDRDAKLMREGMRELHRMRNRAEAAESALAVVEQERDQLRRWKELIARNVAMTREICDDDERALDFIEGFATDRIAMIVPPDMVDPADMAWAIQRGRELAAEHGWASPEEIAAAIERDAALAVPSSEPAKEES